MSRDWSIYVRQGATCEAALLSVDIKLCPHPATFLYRGLKPPTVVEFSFQTIRTTLMLCEDHTKRILTDFAWFIASGEVEVRRLDVERFTVTCKTCLSVSRLEIVGRNVVEMSEAFCPRCGTKGSLKHDPERDWQELFSERFFGMDVRLLNLLFEQWEESRAFPRFVDFVQAQVDEIANEPDDAS